MTLSCFENLPYAPEGLFMRGTIGNKKVTNITAYPNAPGQRAYY